MKDFDTNAIKSMVSQPEWNAIERVIETYLIEMFDLRKIDTTLSATAYKAECLSRLRAAENVATFYRNNKFINKRVEDMESNFR